MFYTHRNKIMCQIKLTVNTKYEILKTLSIVLPEEHPHIDDLDAGGLGQVGGDAHKPGSKCLQNFTKFEVENK